MKKIIYYPAITGDKITQYLQSNPGYQDFYNIDYPYVLLSAGRAYTDLDIRNKLGINHIVKVMGDSGGFQIRNGTLDYYPGLEKEIYNWQKKNTDIILYLDVYKDVRDYESFMNALKKSIPVYEYYSNQSYMSDCNKPKLNILHGNNFAEYKEWDEQTKHFHSSGYAVADCKTPADILFTYNLIKDRCHNGYIHYLGIINPKHIMILHKLQQLNPDIQISFDNSTPIMLAEQSISIEPNLNDLDVILSKYPEIKNEETYLNFVINNLYNYLDICDNITSYNGIISDIYDKLIDKYIIKRKGDINELSKILKSSN